jgi:hypothetical protein
MRTENGNCLEFTALVDIPAGTQLLMSYIDPATELLKRYFYSKFTIYI